MALQLLKSGPSNTSEASSCAEFDGGKLHVNLPRDSYAKNAEVDEIFVNCTYGEDKYALGDVFQTSRKASFIIIVGFSIKD